MLDHRHLPEECRIAFASWRGFDSPLRHEAAFSSCASANGSSNEHRIWWNVEAADAKSALAMLPPYVSARTEVREIGEIRIP
jgi:hypothetical protein